MKEEISQQRCTVGAHGYTNNLPKNRDSKTNVDVIDKKVNRETKLSTGDDKDDDKDKDKNMNTDKDNDKNKDDDEAKYKDNDN